MSVLFGCGLGGLLGCTWVCQEASDHCACTPASSHPQRRAPCPALHQPAKQACKASQLHAGTNAKAAPKARLLEEC